MINMENSRLDVAAIGVLGLISIATSQRKVR